MRTGTRKTRHQYECREVGCASFPPSRATGPAVWNFSARAMRSELRRGFFVTPVSTIRPRCLRKAIAAAAAFSPVFRAPTARRSPCIQGTVRKTQSFSSPSKASCSSWRARHQTCRLRASTAARPSSSRLRQSSSRPTVRRTCPILMFGGSADERRLRAETPVRIRSAPLGRGGGGERGRGGEGRRRGRVVGSRCLSGSRGERVQPSPLSRAGGCRTRPRSRASWRRRRACRRARMPPASSCRRAS